MPPSNRPNVTLSQVAEAAGFAVSTVSYAMRNASNVSPATRRQIQDLARKMGYQENPRIAALMAHIRQSRRITAGERIAFVWVDTPGDSAVPRSLWFEGAHQRAEQLGYKLEEFQLGGRGGLSAERLTGILRARAISGVVVSPLSQYSSFRFDWDNSALAVALIGNAQTSPEFHHSAHHHFAGMHLALTKLREAGCRRIVAVIDRVINDRAKKAWSAAFLEHHPVPSQARRYLFSSTADNSGELARKLSARPGPDVIVTTTGVLDRLQDVPGFRIPKSTKIVLLDWRPNYPKCGGIEQGEDMIAANAVDLVVGQLHRNERGVPERPQMVLLPGLWHPPPGLPRIQ
ncbi:MAG TPA: LacI family DNA-binding transcriptional regulator [Opitutaceae bacterium]|nr:LacI family DNA-binding transcriptional regulator [Opitutaceae bacterium]